MSTRTVQSITYHSFDPGPHFVVLGAIHGDEICGPIAIQRLMQRLNSNALSLTAGTLTFVPICNPKAHALNQRYIDRNLNRELYPKTTRLRYEDHIDPILCGILEKADYLLDLHSYHSAGGPFIFLGGLCKQEQDFARSLGVDHFVYGWADAYSDRAKTDATDPDTQSVKDESVGTVEFARGHGAKAATLECGSHLNADAPDIGEKAILNALAHLNMIDAPRPTIPPEQTCAKMKSVYYKRQPGHFAKPWTHFDRVEAGEVIIEYEDGTTETTSEAGILVLPKAEAEPGTEWVYFATHTPFPCSD